jgi:hypothetical protein
LGVGVVPSFPVHIYKQQGAVTVIAVDNDSGTTGVGQGIQWRYGATGTLGGISHFFDGAIWNLKFDVWSGAVTTRMNINGSTGALRLNAYGAGTLTTDASGNVTASSDQRFKTYVSPFTRGLAAVRGIQSVLFRYNRDSGLEQEEIYCGYFAQQVRQYIPEAVFAHKQTGILSLSDRAIMAAIANSVVEVDDLRKADRQDLLNMITDLKNQVLGLRGQVKSLSPNK